LTFAAIAVCGISLSAAWAQPLPSADRSGSTVYRAACATCHGSDGRGAPRAAVAFTNRLPDFTDCRFAQREADADWVAIIHNGGPARAFAQMMPAFGAVLSLGEIQAALDHVRTFCVDQAWPRGNMNFPKALATEKAFPEDEVLITTTGTTGTDASVTTKAIYERRFGSQTQMELIAPISSHRTGDSTWMTGVGDVAAALKRVLSHDMRSGHILSAAVEVATPTGSSAKGFGGGTTVIEPSLLYGQILPGDAFFQAQVFAGFPLRSGFADELGWRAVLGKTWAADNGFGRAYTPMIEILGARELESGAVTEWDVVPQIQISLSQRQHILFNAGARIPLNETDRPTEILFYLIWDWYDGGFFEGWK
jgi:hypothetical protein